MCPPDDPLEVPLKRRVLGPCPAEETPATLPHQQLAQVRLFQSLIRSTVGQEPAGSHLTTMIAPPLPNVPGSFSWSLAFVYDPSIPAHEEFADTLQWEIPLRWVEARFLSCPPSLCPLPRHTSARLEVTG